MKLVVKYCTVLLAFTFLLSCTGSDSQSGKSNVEEKGDPWLAVDEIKKEVGEITFPELNLNVLDFEAVADGKTINTDAFKKAITECSSKGGGVVVVPAGKYLTGPIHLEDNVNLHLEEGAELLFSTNPKDYYPLVHTSFEGTELMNYSPLIYAYNKKNIGITGKGILNGQADASNWWTWKGSKDYGWEEGMPNQKDEGNLFALMQMAEDSIPVENRVFGDGHYLRPLFIQPFGCEKVLIEGVKIINAPFWIIHPIKCKNVIVDGVHIESHGPNNDGCDPEYSKNVIIRNTTFNTGDDCIAIKSGRNADGRRVAINSENIIVHDCKMIDGHGGVVMGSEISAGVSNVFVENCTMDSPNLDRAIRIKTNSLRGGTVDNVNVRNIQVGQVKEAVLRINLHYGHYGKQEGEFLPVVKNITLENITVKNGGKYGVLAKGLNNSPIKDVILKNVTIEKAKENYSLEFIENIQFIDTYINGELMKSGK